MKDLRQRSVIYHCGMQREKRDCKHYKDNGDGYCRYILQYYGRYLLQYYDGHLICTLTPEYCSDYPPYEGDD